MDEYIKKSDVLEYLSLRRNQVLKSPLSTLDAKFEVMEIFDFVDHRVESADVAPVRHGRNINAEWPSLFECSVCGWSDDDTTTGDTTVYNYCPNCGAKMDGKST